MLPDVLNDEVHEESSKKYIHFKSISKYDNSQKTLEKNIKPYIIDMPENSITKDAICKVTKYKDFFPVLQPLLDSNPEYKNYQNDNMIIQSTKPNVFHDKESRRRRNIQDKVDFNLFSKLSNIQSKRQKIEKKKSDEINMQLLVHHVKSREKLHLFQMFLVVSNFSVQNNQKNQKIADMNFNIFKRQKSQILFNLKAQLV